MRGYVSARRRAEEFAAAVDGDSPPAGADVDAFLQIVLRLREVEQPTPADDFAADLRTRLMAAAPSALAVQVPDSAGGAVRETLFDPRAARRRRAVSLTAISCIVLGTGGGVAAASESALPGDPLYPVKRGSSSCR